MASMESLSSLYLVPSLYEECLAKLLHPSYSEREDFDRKASLSFYDVNDLPGIIVGESIIRCVSFKNGEEEVTTGNEWG